MRTWLYNQLTQNAALAAHFGGVDRLTPAVMPRQSRTIVPPFEHFLIYGLGNDTNENLADAHDHTAHRQFFQVWVHDKSGDYQFIDDTVTLVKAALVNQSSLLDHITTVRWLETSAEFENQTYDTLFRYIRFQAIISEGARS